MQTRIANCCATFLLAQTARCGSPWPAVQPLTAEQMPSPRIRCHRKRSCQRPRRGLSEALERLAVRCARPRRTSPAQIARERNPKREPGIAACEIRELLVVDHILACARRVQECCRHGAACLAPPSFKSVRHGRVSAESSSSVLLSSRFRKVASPASETSTHFWSSEASAS